MGHMLQSGRFGPGAITIVEGKYDDNAPGSNGQLYAWDYADIANVNAPGLFDGDTTTGISGGDRMAAVKLSSALTGATNFTLHSSVTSRSSVGYSANGSTWTLIDYAVHAMPYTFSVPSGALYVVACVENGQIMEFVKS